MNEADRRTFFFVGLERERGRLSHFFRQSRGRTTSILKLYIIYESNFYIIFACNTVMNGITLHCSWCLAGVFLFLFNMCLCHLVTWLSTCAKSESFLLCLVT